MRKAAWVATSLATDPIPGVVLVEPPLLAPAEIAQVHDSRYVEAVRTGEPRDLAESNGFTWDLGLYTSVLASTSGIVAAALHAYTTGGTAGSLSSGLHHARRDSGAAFCTFNGLALAARTVIDAGAQRVLILDLDAHCGGGTVSLGAEWPEVFGVDVSVSAFDAYGAEGRFSLDLVSDAADYLPTVRRRLDEVKTQGIDLVLYNAGMDPHQDAGGRAGITAEVLAEREGLVFDWATEQGVPVAFCLAGGYTGAGMPMARLVGLHRLTLQAAARATRRVAPRG